MTPDSEPTRGNAGAPYLCKRCGNYFYSRESKDTCFDCRLITRLRTERDTFQKVVVERDGEILKLKERLEKSFVDGKCFQCSKRTFGGSARFGDLPVWLPVEKGQGKIECHCAGCVMGWRAELSALKSKEHCEHCGSDRIYHGPPDCPTCGAPNCCQTCCKINTLEMELSALKKRDEWVDVKTRLPEVDQEIEIFSGGSIRVGMYSGKYFKKIPGMWNVQPTHWRPLRELPEPPKRDLTEKGMEG